MPMIFMGQVRIIDHSNQVLYIAMGVKKVTIIVNL